MWLNLYDREAVQRKLKNRQKMQFLCFQAVFVLTSDSLTTIQVELHQCPSHQSILLNPRTNPLNFHKTFLRIGNLEISVFLLVIQCMNMSLPIFFIDLEDQPTCLWRYSGHCRAWFYLEILCSIEWCERFWPYTLYQSCISQVL